MTLVKLKDLKSNYRQEVFKGKDPNWFDVYTDIDNKNIGLFYEILVDESGRVRYLVIDAKWLISGKKILFPIERCRIDASTRTIYALGLTKEQVEALPDYNDSTNVDQNYEERVKAVYRFSGTEQTAPNPELPSYNADILLNSISEEDRASVKLYQERLIADKNRFKTGEVKLGKTVKTETARVAVPIEKEQIVIEQRTFSDVGRVVAPGEAIFIDEEIARMEVYEETALIRKEAFLSGEVSIKKAVEHNTVTAEEILRREELKVDVDGQPLIKRQ